MFTVYKIVNQFNGNFYVGCTKDYRKRIGQHFSRLRKNKHYCGSLQFDFNHFQNRFTHSIIAQFNDKKVALKREAQETTAHSYNLINNTEYSVPVGVAFNRKQVFSAKKAKEFLKNLRAQSA